MAGTCESDSGLLLPSHPFLMTEDPAAAERQIVAAGLEARSLKPREGRGLGMRVTHFRLNEVSLLGQLFLARTRVESSPLSSLNVIVPVRPGGAEAPDGLQFDRTGCIHLTSPGDRVAVEREFGYSCLVLRIPEGTLERHCRIAYGIERLRGIRFIPRVELNDRPLAAILHLLGAILLQAESPGSPLRSGCLRDCYEEALVSSLLRAVPNSVEAQFGAGLRAARPRYLRRALEHIHDNLEREIPMAELVKAADTSLRSLQAAFSQHFGTGPAGYQRRARLQGVREALRAADPERDTVGDIAARWGFYNASSFTVAYQREFGERPSESLGRKQGLQAARGRRRA